VKTAITRAQINEEAAVAPALRAFRSPSRFPILSRVLELEYRQGETLNRTQVATEREKGTWKVVEVETMRML